MSAVAESVKRWPVPWRETAHTQIWNVTEKARQYGTEHPQDDASLAIWVVHAPWMAPFASWHWHYVGLVHLRDLPGQSRAPTRTLAGSTHEFIAMAVDPDYQVDLDPSANWDFKFLTPMSIVQQFIAANDAQALQRVERGLAFVANGNLTLESDGRAAWQRFLLRREA